MKKSQFFRKMFAAALSAAMVLCTLTGYTAAQEPVFSTGSRIRVDLNANDGRQNSYTNNAYNWIVSGTTPTAVFNGVTFKLSNGGNTGSGIRSASYKSLTKSDGTTPTLTMDGVTIKDADKGGVIKLEISGLSSGTHTLTTWHSYFDNWPGGSPVTVTVNGSKSNTVTVPTRVTNDENAGKSFTTFNASGGTVTVLIQPTDTSKNGAVLNAFEIDGADPFKSISGMTPKDGERHLEAEKGLSWTAGSGAKSHDVYIGTDYNSVYNATKNSAEYKGNRTSPNYALDDSYSSLNTYYWRVDEVGSSGVTKGAVYSFQVARLAFPTAEGYGRFARGGQGGRIVEVTNLNDSGSGSLRQALEVEKGPRIVVFRVGGVIQLKSALVIPNDGGEVYVAGQTAPGDGITLINYDFGAMGSSDVIIRNIRVRVGDMDGKSTGGMGLGSCDYSIIDHSSVSWATDEGFSSRSAKNITFQWNIIGESLHDSVHYNGDDRTDTEPHAFAASISGYVGSFHHNLLINCTGRNWSLAGGMEQDALTYGGNVDIRNNVVYNWRDRTTDGGVRRLNFVNNYYKAGAESNTNMHIVSIDGNELNTYDMQKAYVSGNKMVALGGSVLLNPSDDAWSKGKAVTAGKGNNSSGNKVSVSDVRSNSPFFESYVNTQSSDEAYNSVVNGVGANAQGWDYIDSRYIKEVTTGTYTYKGSKQGLKGIIDSQNDAGGYPNSSNFKGGTAPADSDHDGMPDNWENSHGLNPNDSGDGSAVSLSADGYTNVEMYLNELAGDPVVFNGGGGEPLEGNMIKSLVVKDTANAADWSIQNNLQTGDVIYGDRANTFTNVSNYLKGAEWIRMACDSKNLQSDVAEFTAGSAITVYIGLDTRVSNLPSWLSGWTANDYILQASNDVTYKIYQKNFNQGDKVTLGTNGPPSGVVMYTAFVKQAVTPTPEPAPVTGDVTYIAEDFANGRQNEQSGTFTLKPSYAGTGIQALFSSDGTTIDNEYVKGYKDFIGNSSSSSTKGDPYVSGVNLSAGTYTMYYLGSNNRGITMNLASGSGTVVSETRTQTPVVITEDGSARELWLSAITFTLPQDLTEGSLTFTNSSTWLPDLYAVKFVKQLSYIAEDFSKGRQNEQARTFAISDDFIGTEVQYMFCSNGTTIDNEYVKGYKNFIGNPNASNTLGDPYVNGINLSAGTHTVYFIGAYNRGITMSLSDGSGVVATAERTESPVTLTPAGAEKELQLSKITFTLPQDLTNGTLTFTNLSTWLPDLYAVKIV